jgi:hypothetical protein
VLRSRESLPFTIYLLLETQQTGERLCGSGPLTVNGAQGRGEKIWLRLVLMRHSSFSNISPCSKLAGYVILDFWQILVQNLSTFALRQRSVTAKTLSGD